MSEQVDLIRRLDAVAAAAGRCKAEAYIFVWEALGRALGPSGRPHHVSGGELLAAIRDLAQERYGPLAKDVFNAWGVATTLDFGCIVFDLVEAKLLTKTPDDSLADFADKFDFQRVFEDDYFRGRA